MMKILHITTNNKFISFALDSFESVYPNCNYIWILGGGEKKYKNQKNISKRQCISISNIKDLKNYDAVILHSLDLYWYFFVLFSNDIKFIWVGWGFDYYDLIESKDNIVLNETKQLCKINKINKINIKDIIIKLFKLSLKRKVIKKIDKFAPVLKLEYDLFSASNSINCIPKYGDWNYGSIERSFIKEFKNKRISGKYILVGNSATETNNHIEIINILKNINSDNKYIFPLNYGNEKYKKIILGKGKEILRDKFYPIENFMEYEKYIDLLTQCNAVIMNHVRQQGLGNIFVVLYFGARVFLRKENPIYKTLYNYGFVINTIDDINHNHSIIEKELTDDEVLLNRKLLIKYWGDDIMDIKTKNILY